ncbi:MAG: sugar phosphate nucleotidyltransferase [Bacteroidales bacterium]
MVKIQYSAIIPGAGKGSRLSHLPYSKELLPVGYSISKNNEKHPKTISAYLLDHFQRSGIREVHFIIRKGKTDIAEYFESGNNWGVNISYHLTEVDFGVPFTIDQAYYFFHNKNILFGFPDILFYPQNAFIQMKEYLNEHPDIDIVLGLFPVSEQQKWDTVLLKEKNRIERIRVKEGHNKNVKYAWIIAAWRPSFSDFLHDTIAGFKSNPEKIMNELFMGHVIQMAIDKGLKVNGLPFENGGCLDIGTPEGYIKAENFLQYM